MENLNGSQLIEALLALSALISVAIFAIGKHLMPWVWKRLTGQYSPDSTEDGVIKLKKEVLRLEQWCLKLETNHLAHVQADIDEIKKTVADHIRDDQRFRENMIQRMATLEALIRNKI